MGPGSGLGLGLGLGIGIGLGLGLAPHGDIWLAAGGGMGGDGWPQGVWLAT